MAYTLPNTLQHTLISLASLSIFLLSLGNNAMAERIVSLQSGDWTDASTWSNTISDGDEVIIQSGHTVTISTGNLYNSSTPNLQITVNGILSFEDSKIFLDEDAIIEIASGGLLRGIGNNNNEKVKIGGGNVWEEKNGNFSGPYRFTQFGGEVVLPVVAVYSLNAEHNADGSVSLAWKNEVIDGTGSELVIEGSYDGSTFEDLDFITSNTFSGTQDITLPDNGFIYFRVGIIDENGNRQYSSVASLGQGASTLTKVFPNPITDQTFYLTGKNIQSVSLQNNQGIVIHQYGQNTIEGFASLSLPDKLPNGIYYLRIIAEQGIETIPISIQR